MNLVERSSKHDNSLPKTITRISDYVAMTKRIRYQCICGHEWSALPYNVIYNKSGCPKCAKINMAKLNTLPVTSHLKFLDKKNIRLLSNYINKRTPCLYQCQTCNNTWSQLPYVVEQSKIGCEPCSYNFRSKVRTQPRKLHVKKLKDRNIKLVSKYTKKVSLNTYKCKICGYSWKCTASRIERGVGCAQCKKVKRVTKEEHINTLPANLVLVGEYKGTKYSTSYFCKDCTNIWKAKPNQIRNGQNCPNCSPKHYSTQCISWLEELSKVLRIKIQHAQNGGELTIKNGVTYNSHYRLDGYNKRNNIAFEFHGDYWHGKTNKNSTKYKNTLRKEKFLLRQGLILVRIWESEYRKNLKGSVFFKGKFCQKAENIAQKLNTTVVYRR